MGLDESNPLKVSLLLPCTDQFVRINAEIVDGPGAFCWDDSTTKTIRDPITMPLKSPHRTH